MPETLTNLKNADVEFFQRIRQETAFAAMLEQLGFEEPYIGQSQHNSVFIITKSGWTLPRPAGHERTLNIHFEAKDRREMRLEVGPEPWIGGLDRKPAEKAALEPVLSRKMRLIGALRYRLLGASDIPKHFDTNIRRLLAPTETASHGVVKFSGRDYDSDPSVEQVARWFSEVIETVTPIVDDVAARYQAS